MRYEWDLEKAESNLKKHGVSFEEATVVFEDHFGLEQFDALHSTREEKRFIRIGLSNEKVLNVVFVIWDEANEVYRLITARKATRFEQVIYWEQRYEK